MAAIGPSDVILRANPALMEAKADEIKGELGRIKEEFANITQSVCHMNGYWNGEAAELYRKRYKELEPTAEEMFSRISEHASDIQAIARVYTGTEQRATSMAAGLPKDAIE